MYQRTEYFGVCKTSIQVLRGKLNPTAAVLRHRGWIDCIDCIREWNRDNTPVMLLLDCAHGVYMLRCALHHASGIRVDGAPLILC
jgi:hypothetical protein